MKSSHKHRIVAAVVGTAAVVAAVAFHGVTAPTAARIAPAIDYPATPGMAATVDATELSATYSYNCPSGKAACTYSQSHRNVPQSEKDQIYATYESLYPGITAYCHETGFTNGANQRCEVDHFIPVCAGGANVPENLSIQRADNTYNGQPMGFHQKDDLESWGCAQIKAGKLAPQEFQQKLVHDWVAYYLEVNPAHGFGGN